VDAAPGRVLLPVISTPGMGRTPTQDVTSNPDPKSAVGITIKKHEEKLKDIRSSPNWVSSASSRLGIAAAHTARGSSCSVGVGVRVS
jgi:hypothetical protein